MENKSIYILSIEGKSILKAMSKYGEFNTKFTIEKDGNVKKKDLLDKYLSGCLPFSLETIELNRYAPKEIKKKDNKQYTKAIVNIKFNFKDDNGDLESLREQLYTNGFKLDGTHYRVYKRSSAKSKNGSCLFIKDKLFKHMLEWSRLGLEFEKGEMVDFASLKAYESLTLSSLENTIKINPKEILIVEDIKSKFKEMVSVTTLDDNGNPTVSNREEWLENTLFDGESLGDESLFKGIYKNKGFMLLRARFLKSAVFNTRLQEFFKYTFKDDYNIATVKDKYGADVPVKDIKLVITENSLKFLKFAYKFSSEEECYRSWIDNVGDEWGICKTEHNSKFGNGTYNQLSYQMIMSMDLNKKEVRELLSEEIKYINSLKNDIAVFKNYIELNNDSPTRRMMLNLLSINNQFKDTQIFKDWKRNVINKYIENIMKGKVKVPNTDYAVIFGNAYEYLLHAIGRFKGESSLNGNEVYSSRYKPNISLVGFRSPNINQGNVMSFINKDWEERKWFNLTDNIIVVNAINNGIQDRGQGLDYDSDMLLLSDYNPIVEKGIDCQKYLTPVNHIVSKKKLRPYNLKSLAEVDYLISENYIGFIVNVSAHLLAYYWHEKNTNNNKEKLSELYNYSSLCSSLAGLEIDKSKKFVEVDTKTICEDIKKEDVYIKTTKEIEYLNKYGTTISRDIETTVNPLFFKSIDKKPKSIYKKLECPMDYLIEVLKEEIEPKKREKNISLKDLLVKGNNLRENSNRKQIESIVNLVSDYDNKINSFLQEEDGEEMKIKIDRETSKIINKLEKLKIKKETLIDILSKLESKYKNIGIRILMLFFNSHLSTFLSCFIPQDGGEYLDEDEEGNIVIWGKRYKRV